MIKLWVWAVVGFLFLYAAASDGEETCGHIGRRNKDVLGACDNGLCGATERLGAELLDMGDLKEMDDAKLTFLLQAIHDYGVVVVPGQNLTRHEQVELTGRIGEVVVLPPSFEGRDPEPGEPAIQRVTNFWGGNGTWKGPSHSFGAYWHQDGQFWTREKRYLVSLLYSEQAPPGGYGGQTGFADIRMARDTLSASLMQLVQDKVIVASVRDIADFTRNGVEEELAAFPEVRHPIIDTHPSGDGKPNLYVGSPHMKVMRYQGQDEAKEKELMLSKEDAGRLLTMVIDHSTGPSFTYYHKWRRGDVVFWDNTQTLHKAMPFNNDGKHHRELYRTQARLTPDSSHLAEV